MYITNHTQEHLTQRHVYITHRLHILAHITHRDTCIINRGAYPTEALITIRLHITQRHTLTQRHTSTHRHTYTVAHISHRGTHHIHTQATGAIYSYGVLAVKILYLMTNLTQSRRVPCGSVRRLPFINTRIPSLNVSVKFTWKSVLIESDGAPLQPVSR